MLTDKQKQYARRLQKTQRIPLLLGIMLILSILPILFLGFKFIDSTKSTYLSAAKGTQNIKVFTQREASLQKSLYDEVEFNRSLSLMNVKIVIIAVVIFLFILGIAFIIYYVVIHRLLNIVRTLIDLS